MKSSALTGIEQLFSEFKQSHKFLMDQKEISFATDYTRQYAKIALLACASYFESETISLIHKF